MAGVFRPALRSLASARCHAPMPPTSIAASASSQAEGQLWPESHAGPSRLSQPASRIDPKERSRAPSFMAGRDRSEMVAKGHQSSVISRQPDVALQSQPARLPGYGKGKARLIDEDDQPSWLSAPGPPFQPMPTGHPAQPLLYLPSRRELLGAISDDYLGFQSAWAKAFQHSSFKEAVSILRKHSGSDDIFRPTPPRLHKLANLLFLRLLDSVQTAQDVEIALECTRLLKSHVVYHAYALSVLAERALRDLKAAHLCRPLYEHAAALARRTEASHELHSVPSLRLATRQAAPRFASKRRSLAFQRERSSRRVRDMRVVQDLLLRLAFLLPSVRDLRSVQTARSLLYLVTSRCRVSRRLWDSTSNSDTHDWRPPRRILRMLHHISRSRRRRRRAFTHPPEFLAIISRAFLGSSSFNTSPYSAAALDTTVFVPPPLIPHPTRAFTPRRRRNHPSHLTYWRESSWLSCDLAQACVGIVSFLPVGHGAGRDRIWTYDLQPLLMAAVREERRKLAETALQQIMRLGLADPAQDDSGKLVSARASLPAQACFRARASPPIKISVEASDVESQIERDAREAYQMFIMLQKMNRNARRPYGTPNPRSQAPMGYSHALSNVVHQVTSGSSILGPLIPPTTPSQTLQRQQQLQSREAQIYHTAARGVEVFAESSQYQTRDILICFGINHHGDERRATLHRPAVENHSFRASGLPTSIRQTSQAYVSAMRGFGKRGAFRASDALFRALVRRASSEESQYRLVRLDGSVLRELWLAVQFSAVTLDRQGKGTSFISHYVKERVDRILALIGLDVKGSRMSVSDCTLMRAIRVEPSAPLLAALIHGLRKWDMDAFAGLDLFFSCRERWPHLISDVSVLDSVLLASQRLVALPRGLPQRPSVVLDNVLDLFRRHLLAQHPSLCSLTGPSWGKVGSQARRDASARTRRRAVAKVRKATDEVGQFVVNFDARTFRSYFLLLSAKLRRILIECPRPIPGTVLRFVDELVLALAWMRELGIQPDVSILRSVFLPLKYVYRCQNQPWPKGVQRVTIREADGRKRVARDGMGPLSAWMDEWVDGELPSIKDVEIESARWERDLLAERERRQVPSSSPTFQEVRKEAIDDEA
ncbi:unnamed protein product [Tilletia controversa]|nr:unnamed protein product [Tilletia controversa]CAD6980643.1 unnamed protein product [Tilletia controversa]